MDWVKEHILTILGAAFSAAVTIGGGVKALFAWHSERLDQRQGVLIASAVSQATAEMMADLVDVRERVATLEAHFSGTRDALEGMRTKLDDLDGHVRSLPERVAEMVRK